MKDKTADKSGIGANQPKVVGLKLINIIYGRRAGQYDRLEAQVDGARFGLEIDPPNVIFHTMKDKNWQVFQWVKESVVH